MVQGSNPQSDQGLSVWTVRVGMCFFQVLQLPPTVHSHAISGVRLTDDSKLHISVNICPSVLVLRQAGILSRVYPASCLNGLGKFIIPPNQYHPASVVSVMPSSIHYLLLS